MVPPEPIRYAQGKLREGSPCAGWAFWKQGCRTAVLFLGVSGVLVGEDESGVLAPEHGAERRVEGSAAPQLQDPAFESIFPTDGVAAQVGAEVITRRQVYEKLRLELDQLKFSYEGLEYLRKARALWDKTLLEVLEEKVFLEIAKRERIEIPPDELERDLRETIQKIGSREDFYAYLRQRRMTYEQYRERRQAELVREEVVASYIGVRGVVSLDWMPRDSFVTPEELRRYYEEHKGEFVEEEKVTARLVELHPADWGSREAARKQAAAFVRQLDRGADFADLADWYSSQRRSDAIRSGVAPGAASQEPGYFHAVSRQVFAPAIADLVFSVPVGQIGGPLETAETFTLVKVEEKTPYRQRPFEEVQQEVFRRMRAGRIQENYRMVRRDLLRKAYIWPPGLLDSLLAPEEVPGR